MTLPNDDQTRGIPAEATESASYRRVVSEFPTTRLIVARPDGSIKAEWVGEEVARITGYRAAEFEADPDLWISIVHPDDRNKVRNAWLRLAEGKETHVEYRIFRKDGQLRWIADTGISNSEDGVFRCIQCSADITAAKAGQEWSVDFAELIDKSPNAVTVRDLTGRVVYANDGAARLYGYRSSADMLGTTFEDMMSPEFATEFRERIFPLILAGPWTGEVPIRTRSGALAYVKATSNLFRDDQGRPVAIYSILADISRLKQTEQALRASERRFGAVQNSMPANLAVIDAEGTIVAVNERWRRFARDNGDPDLSHTCEGVNYLDVCQRADGPYSEGAMEARDGLAALLRGEIDEFEQEYPCPSSEQSRWFLMRAAPLRDGQPGAVIAHIDISRRKRAEQKLRESEEKYRSILENLDALVFRVDANMNPIMLVGHIEQLIGYTREEIERHPSVFREMLHPDDLGEIWELLRRTAAHGTPQPFEFRVRHRTGETRWIRGTLTPVFDDAGNLIHYDGISLEVTKLRSAEKARRESEDRLRNLVDTADAVIFRVTPENAPIALFGRVAEISGYSIPELLESPVLWKSCIHPDDAEAARESYKEIAATGKRTPIELRIVSKSGATHWIRTQVTPRYDSQGNLLYFDGVGLDITESVEAQQREARHADRMRAITEVSRLFVSTLDSQRVLDIATQRLCETLDSIGVGITIDPSSGRLSHLSICCPHGCEIESLDQAVRRSGLRVEDVIGPGEIVSKLVPDLGTMSEITACLVDAARLPDGTRIGPGAMAPVTAGADAVGALFVARHARRELDDEDLWFITEVASRASAALANAALYGRQARIAEVLQRSLIPATPSIKCLDVATMYAPAPGEAEVGGDFLDMFLSSCRSVGLVVGDVSGKGLEAAIHTAEAKYMLRAFAHENPDPQHVITCLNHALCDYLPEETFVTLIYIRLNVVDHTMTYASAGHESSIVLCRHSDSVRELGPTGPALGLMEDAVYTTRDEMLELDDMLFCYTDGITDVRTNGKRFGYTKLKQTILEAPQGDAESLMNHVIDTVRSFGATKQTDDQVILVVKPRI